VNFPSAALLQITNVATTMQSGFVGRAHAVLRGTAKQEPANASQVPVGLLIFPSGIPWCPWRRKDKEREH
jgi:hypothetical protein